MNIWATVMIWAVAGIFSTSFRLLSTTRTQQACEVFIIARAVLQDFEAFLVYFDESLQSVTPSHSSWVGWLLVMSHAFRAYCACMGMS